MESGRQGFERECQGKVCRRGYGSVTEILASGLCIGCGMCSAICPHSAIVMNLDSRDAFVVPQVLKSQCTGCGMCVEVCPGIEYGPVSSVGEPDTACVRHKTPKVYVGFSNDDEIRYSASSGGLVTQIIMSLLESGYIDGAVVTRMTKSDPTRAEGFLARTSADVAGSSGSKYCPVPVSEVLEEVIKSDGRYAMVGLPCHINGLVRGERVDRRLESRVVLRLGLFCSGVPSYRATRLLLSRYGYPPSRVARMSYRGKGWPGYMTIRSCKGAETVLRYPDYYQDMNPELFIHRRCWLCLDWFASNSDISFGDAWHCESSKADRLGTSLVVSWSRIGDSILEKMMDDGLVTLTQIDVSCLSLSQLGYERKKRAFNHVVKFFDPLDLHRSAGYSRVRGDMICGLRVNCMRLLRSLDESVPGLKLLERLGSLFSTLSGIRRS